jgi:heme/copper-type cytochrome/quinol oxidase subunit 1
MPRRIPDYPDLIMNWNFLSSCGSSLTLLGFLFIYVCWARARHKKDTTKKE